jgi:stage II sporulation protein AA (anti-sigma F factor antagonist)
MSARPDFELATDSEGARGTRVVRVQGELDSGTCEALEAECRRAVEEPEVEQLTLDLAAVSFIDSAGMRTMILIEQSAREHDVRLIVVPPPEQVTALLRTAGVAQRMTFRGRSSSTARPAEFSERVELELPREPMAPSRARAEVRELMADRPEAKVAELVLLTSELVTNAVVHARSAGPTPIGLRIVNYDHRVRIEVEDAGDGFDPAAPRRPNESGGKGLFLVESFATDWGARRIQTERGPRFCVWLEFQWSEQLSTAPATV